MTDDLRLVRLCLNLECRVGSFRSGTPSELHVCPACGAEGAEISYPPERSSAADGRDQRDPQQLGLTLLHRRQGGNAHKPLTQVMDEGHPDFDRVADYVDGDTIAKYGDPRQVTK